MEALTFPHFTIGRIRGVIEACELLGHSSERCVKEIKAILQEFEQEKTKCSQSK